MKKLLLGLGTLATIVAPIAAVVSCSTGTHTDKKDKTNNPTVTDITGGNDGGTFTEGTPDKRDLVLDLSTKLGIIAPGIIGATSGKTLADAEFNGDLIRLTYKVDDSELGEASDESADLSVVRLTINLKTGVIAKIEYDPGTGTFEDKTDNMVYKDAFDASKVKAAAEITYKAIKALPASIGDPMAQAIAATKKTITDSSVDQAIKTAALNALENVKDTAGYTTYLASPEYIAFQAAVNGGNAGGSAVTLSDDEKKAELKSMVVDEILPQTNYEMADHEVDKLVKELFKLDGAEELAPLEFLKGIKGDATHGKDDFMVLIGGTDQEELTGSEFSTDGSLLKRTDPTDPTKIGNIGSVLDNDKTQSLEKRWGESETEVKDANFVLFLQHNDNTGAITVELNRVVKFGDKIFAIDALRPDVVEPGRPNSFNAKFAIGEFSATYAPTSTETGSLSDAAELVKGFQAKVRADQTDANVLDLANASLELQDSIDVVLASATKVGEVILDFRKENEPDQTVTFFNVKDSDDLKKLKALKGGLVISIDKEDDATFNGVDPHSTELMKTVFTDEIKVAGMTITKYITPADTTDTAGDKVTYAISFLNTDGSYTSPIAFLASKAV